MEELYPSCLDIGISPSSFYNHSIDELNDLLSSHERRKKNELKERLISTEILANQISDFVACLLDKNNVQYVRRLWDYYPKLFISEKRMHDETKKQTDLQMYKAQFKAFAEDHNRLWEEELNDIRRT